MENLPKENNKMPKDVNESIVYYGIFALVIGGGAGVWIPLLIPGKALASDGLATYVFAVLAPLLADAVLHEPYWKSLSVAVRMRILFGCGLAGAAALIALLRDGKSGDWVAGFFGVGMSLLIWFFITKYSRRFEPNDAMPPTGSFGGPTPEPSKLGGGGLQ